MNEGKVVVVLDREVAEELREISRAAFAIRHAQAGAGSDADVDAQSRLMRVRRASIALERALRPDENPAVAYWQTGHGDMAWLYDHTPSREEVIREIEAEGDRFDDEREALSICDLELPEHPSIGEDDEPGARP